MACTTCNGIKGIIHAEVEKTGASRLSLMPILAGIQAAKGYISDEAMQDVADALGIRPVEVEEVVSFYHFFRTAKAGRYIFRLCQTVSCDMAGKARVARQLESDLGIKFGETTPDGLFTLEYTNCMGMCDQGPAMMVNDRVFVRLTPQKVHEVVSDCRRHFGDYRPGLVGFEGNLRKSGLLLGGPSAPNAGLKKALSEARSSVIAEIRTSHLRGRGGAGFPTATKWQLAAAAKGEQKYVVCNADEGEPGTFKDRLLLMEYPDLMLEGMTIAGYAIRATNGVIYLRGEYTFLKEALEARIEARRKDGLLGQNILGKEGFTFDIRVFMGAGAYVCGEETALIESMEGKRGEPRNRPPFPVNAGYNNCPTAVNNVETYVNAALIMDKGGEWYRANGTDQSTGTKLFSISGDCRKPGIYEFPMGITVAEMLKEVGGEDAKAVQVGGASGQCVPRTMFGNKIAYESSPPGGSIVVFGPQRDMLEVAENFMEFFCEESCGQCIPCRKGTRVLLEGIHLLKQGKCSVDHLERLRRLGATISVASKCGLGQSAPNIFNATTEHFRDEILGRQS